jgi:hypothetical protein
MWIGGAYRAADFKGVDLDEEDRTLEHAVGARGRTGSIGSGSLRSEWIRE